MIRRMAACRCDQQMQALNPSEILSVLKLASENRRNHAMILLTFKHGLRASEVCNLRLPDIDLKHGTITIRRLQGSLRSAQDLLDIPGEPLVSEKLVLRAWLEERTKYDDSSNYVFLSQKGGRLHRSAFFRVFQSIAEDAGLPPSKRHPRCLRHSLGYFLVEQGVSLPSVQQTLGHRSPSSTRIYRNITDDQANFHAQIKRLVR